MPRLREDSIGRNDLIDYLDGYSDFSFELQTLRELRGRGLECEHAGLYEDPVTKKSREFDIRAVARAGQYCVRLAIECKNVRENFPLLVSCVPRHEDESFHQIAIVGELIADIHDRYHGISRALASRAHIVRVSGSDSRYKPKSPVGKSLAQVGRLADKQRSIFSADNDVFEKWSQCLASADDLVSRCYGEGEGDPERVTFVCVIPVIVLPDGRLWVVEYDLQGERLNEPVQAEQCSLFVGKEYTLGQFSGSVLNISHIELMTLRGLSNLVEQCLQGEKAMERIFPSYAMSAALDQLER